MPNQQFDQRIDQLLQTLSASGQFKQFHHITTPMQPIVHIDSIGEVLVLCANNYLGLANHPDVVEAGIEGLRKYGAGTASVRFICGTFDCHREIESAIARFVGTKSALTYVSGFSANEAVFPTLLGENDVILSDQLNHASIIDGIRLVGRKVARSVYPHCDLDSLRQQLVEHRDKDYRWVVTDGVFSMEGDVAPLDELVKLCAEHNALLVVDDAHGIGVLGSTGRGTPEHCGVLGQIDILTGTLGKALGGGAGGYVAASNRVIELLKQRSRPSLFSNALPATIACSARKAIEIVEAEPQYVTRLHQNVRTIRDGLAKLGYQCQDSPTAIIPIMIGDAAETQAKSARLMQLGVMVTGFSYPVVPEGEARLRVQVSAALEPSHIEKALDAFAKL